MNKIVTAREWVLLGMILLIVCVALQAAGLGNFLTQLLAIAR